MRERNDRRLCTLSLGLLCCAFSPAVARADIFAQEQQDGTLFFTDAPVTGGYRVVIRESLPPSAREEKAGPAWTDVARREASRRRLDPLLVKAVIQIESGEDPSATSPKGAKGLMQLMPSTAQMLGVEDPYEPKANIRGGVQYLSAMLERFGRLDLALAAYNAGPGAVERFRGIPPYRETRNYVTRVLDAYRKLGGPSSLDSPQGPVDNRVSLAERE
ncbi:MAG: lytic transglycosylase domain-containing protein [Deltaproteobacteria bacterium]|nr:lytic transglycosylase domain-containing protein [Deltaproteobacteria bacterium]